MAMTLPTAEDLFEETVRKVSSTPQEWLKFLNTASRVYQYTFDAQLMIYAQRPNAIGCTSFEKWKQMNHYVKRGTQGIALIVRNSENRKLRYVYGINTHRLLVREHCTGTGEPQHIHVTAEAFQIDSTIMASVIGILLLILLLIRVLICTRKKGREGRYSRYDQALLYMKKTDILKNNKRDNNTKN